MTSDAEVKANLAANVERLLEVRDMSQTQLAEAAEASQATISRIIDGLHLPNAAILVRLAEALDVTIDRLTGPPATPPQKKSA